ncbi:MAG TPA: isoaspartyl peptidase/L-asparaginase, partial [Balneolales bacterium]|nr:isoaspartyl peptidase/L-asparaginase [Balneolales bacterium]
MQIVSLLVIMIGSTSKSGGVVMRKIGVFVFLVVLSASCTKSHSEQMNNGKSSSDSVKWAIVIHGGAGVIDKSIPDSVRQVYVDALTRALGIGIRMLKNGAHGLDVVEKVINSLEDDPHFNAGRGSVYTHAGTHEMDAAIMDGSNLQAGAVAGVKHVKNPISAARLVMEKTPHVLLSGDGADQFAREQGLPMEPQSYFDTERRKKQWQQLKDKESYNQDMNEDPATYFDEHKFGTVGCAVLDTYGNLTAGTST